MIAALPVSDVGLIAGILGLFFLLAAAYKSIFHRRRTPPEKMIDALLDGRATDPVVLPADGDNQPVKVQDPFRQPDDARASEPAAPAAISAFRHFTTANAAEADTPPSGATYVWE